MGLEFEEQVGAFGFARTFKGDALLIVGRAGRDGAKGRTAQAACPG